MRVAWFLRQPQAASGHYTVDGLWTIDKENTLPENRPPENTIIALTQTRDGYLWLGTLNGLVRFDGVRFTVFDESDTPGLNDNQVVHLFEDSQSNLWVGTRSDGVVLIKNGRAINIGVGHGGREGRLMSACEDSEGAVWLYTADGQLCRYQNGKGTVWQLPERASVCRSVIAEKSGPVWVGTDYGIYKINPKADFGTNAAPLCGQVYLVQAARFSNRQ